MLIEENYLSENNLTPEAFEKIVQFRKSYFDEDLDINQIQFVRLRITGGLNRAGMFFTNRTGQKFYPDIISVNVARTNIRGREVEENGAGLVKYGHLFSTDYLGLEPMELCFNGYIGRTSHPNYDFGLSFWAYQGFENMVSAFEIKKLECPYPDRRPGNPEIVLESFFLRNGELAYKDWIREKFSARNVDYKKWTF